MVKKISVQPAAAQKQGCWCSGSTALRRELPAKNQAAGGSGITALLRELLAKMRSRIAVAAVAAVLLACVVPQTKSRLTTALGRFFRDVARARARTRRYGNKYA